MKPRDAWLAALGQLQIQLHQATYNSWIAGSEFEGYEDGVFTIRVPTAYAKDWLEQRLYRLVQTSISTMFGEEVQVKFTVQPQVKKKQVFRPLPEGLPGFEDYYEQQRQKNKQTNPGEGQGENEGESQPEAPVSLYAPPVEKTPAVQFEAGSQLNSDYTFDTFVEGSSNQLAYAAAKAVAEGQRSLYNPLLIYSDVGLGKTHLLQAIAHVCQQKGKKCRYVTAETFTNDMVRAIRTRQTDAFREHYRELDMLLVDDIYFFSGKEGSQEEFYHTFNMLHLRKAQIVLATDHTPDEMPDLSDRLRSRLAWGLVVEVHRPDHSTRMAILQQKAAAQQIDLPLPVADLIATRAHSSVRHLEGILNRVLALHTLTRQPLTPDYVEMVMKHSPLQTSPKVTLKLEHILETTATYHQLALDDLLSKERSKHIATARHMAIYLAREEMDASLQEIGRALGGRTHSTIINSYNKAVELLKDDPEFRKMVTLLREKLHHQAIS